MTQITKRAASVAALVCFAALLAAPMAAQLESEAAIDVTAFVTVGWDELIVTTGDALVFNDVVAGTPSTAGSPGTFTVSGESGEDVMLDFELPTFLTHTGGEATIPIGFTGGDGSWDNLTVAPVPFDPTASEQATIGATGALNVSINGTVSPPVAGTVEGEYGGTITLTVAYVL